MEHSKFQIKNIQHQMKTIALAALAIFGVTATDPLIIPVPAPVKPDHHHHAPKVHHHSHLEKKHSGFSAKLAALKDRKNYVVDGKFETPKTIVDPFWTQVQGGTTAWKASNLEVGQGTVYNYKWKPKTQVIELDSDSNQVITQAITTLTAGKKYHLSFEWAARVGYLETSGGIAKWNGKSVVIMDPHDINVHQSIVTVIAQDGTNTIEFDGTKASDSFGLGVTNVKLEEIVEITPKQHQHKPHHKPKVHHEHKVHEHKVQPHPHPHSHLHPQPHVDPKPQPSVDPVPPRRPPGPPAAQSQATFTQGQVNIAQTNANK